MKVVIIEDEHLIAQRISTLLSQIDPGIEILSIIDSVKQSVDWFKSGQMPDLVFMDIQLSDGLSFEIFKKIELAVPIIFTTAFDEYAIQAFKVNSVDYLLKPIKQTELNDALKKFDTLDKQIKSKLPTLNLNQIQQLLNIKQTDYKSRFIAKLGDQIKHIDVKDVAYFRAEDNEVMLITINNNKYIIDYSLDQLSGVLNPNEFFRANRSYIVTINSIAKISKYFNSRLHLELEPKSEDTVLISRVKVSEFLKWMDK